MHTARKNFFFGLGIGFVVALVAFQIWSGYVERSISAAAQPHIIHPFRPVELGSVPSPSEGLAHPWVPQVSGSIETRWELSPLDGKPVTLAQFKGKAVFLNFWNTGCGPCIEEMPGIKRLADSLKDRQVVFAAVTQETEQDVRNFVRKNDVGVPVYLSGQEVPEELKVVGVPTTYLLDSKGSVAFMHVGPLNWDDDQARRYLLHLASQ